MAEMSKMIFAILFITVMNSTKLEGSNLIQNGSFEGDNSIWKLQLNSNQANEATLSFSPTSHNNSLCATISIVQAPAENWHVQLIVPKWYVERNAIYRLSFMAKGAIPIQIGISYGNNVQWPFKENTYKEGLKFFPTSNWSDFSGEFSSNIEGEGPLVISMNFGTKIGEVSLDDLVLQKVDQIDQQDTWYSQANQRIDTIRKGKIQLAKIVDFSGKSISSGTAKIKLKKHAFQFGTSAIFADSISAADNEWYKDKIKTIFNSITVESAFKWVDYEPLPDQVMKKELLKYTAFADTNNFAIRGHALAWALQMYGFENHWPQKLSDKELIAALKKRIIRDVTDYKGKISEYDVWNEPYNEQDWFKRLEYLNHDKNNYLELLDSSFHWARSVDSSAGLYINEYAIVAGGQTADIIKLVRGMINRKVPITGIGAQCHFGNNPIEPYIIRKRLDSLGQLGLKIKITEFDLGSPEKGVLLSEQVMASEYAKFLRTTFSHPAVDGITMWGFWDRLIWNKPHDNAIGSGLFNTNKTPKQAADSVLHLINTEWNTDTTVDLSSINSLNGFYGDYDITIKNSNSTWIGTFSHTKNKPVDSIKVKLDTPTQNHDYEKKTQCFLATTDKKNRVVAISGASVGFPTTLQVLDLRGRLIYQFTTESVDSFRFSLNTVPDGMYVYILKNGSAMIQKKLLLMR